MIKNNIGSVVAIVVTYNRKQLLVRCLNALLEQTEPLNAIYVIDNASTDGTAKYLKENDFINETLYSDREPVEDIKFVTSKRQPNHALRLTYLRMHENTGGAGGFYEGVKRGYEAGFDWLWLMDDDGMPEKEALSKLTKHISSNTGTFIASLSCLVVSNQNNELLAFGLPKLNSKNKPRKFTNNKYVLSVRDAQKRSNGGIYEWAHFFNGVIVNKKAIEKAGYIKKELFIWGDEVDYFFRLKKVGKVGTLTDAFFYHPPFNNQTIPLWKRCYGLRNSMYLVRKHYDYKILRLLKIVAQNLVIFLKNKAPRLYLKAVIDSFKL